MSKKGRKKEALVHTKYGSFLCMFEPELDMSGYVVTSPAVRGAVSWGKNLAEAKKMVAEAIEGIIEVRVITKAAEEGEVRITRPRMKVLA